MIEGRGPLRVAAFFLSKKISDKRKPSQRQASCDLFRKSDSEHETKQIVTNFAN